MSHVNFRECGLFMPDIVSVESSYDVILDKVGTDLLITC